MIFIYIDPGAGSMIFQALLAGLLAMPFLFRTQASRLFRRLRRQVDDEHEDASRD